MIKWYVLLSSSAVSLFIGVSHLYSHTWIRIEDAAWDTYTGTKIYKYYNVIKESEMPKPPPMATPEPRVEDFMRDASEKFSIPYCLLHGLMGHESRESTEAYSLKGAIGLLQVMPTNAAWCGVKPSKLWDEKININCGAKLLRENLDNYRKTKEPLRNALRVYNGGPKCLKGCAESEYHSQDVMMRTANCLLNEGRI